MTTTHSEEQAKAQLASIREMVAALECDYDRLGELRDDRDTFEPSEADGEPSRCPACGSGSYQCSPAVGGDDMACADCGQKWFERDDGSKLLPPLTWVEAFPVEAEELAELEAAAGDCDDADEARQRIEEDALSVQVRGDWHTPGHQADALEPAEYEILLCTGGPACRIVGDLSSGEPSSARLEHQDWGTPWTEHFEAGAEEVLLKYARCFRFCE